MLGRDAHVNANQTHNKFLSIFWSSILFLMPPHFYERVDKWTHERRSIFNHKKTLLLAFTISAIKSCENTKISFLLATINKNPKISLFTRFSLLSSYSLLYCIFIIVICFTNIDTLCLTTTWWSWGHKAINFALQVARRGKEKLRLIPREFDINPWVTLVGKTRLLHCDAPQSGLCSFSDSRQTPHRTDSKTPTKHHMHVKTCTQCGWSWSQMVTSQ